jgi:UDP-N-acetylglucosamine 3-dehydrogenase
MYKIRLGLIGLGYIGKVHLRNCLKLDSAELVAVSDISNKALNLAKKMGIKNTYSDYKTLLNDKSIDAVIIALPTHLHLSCAKQAAEAGKHILIEKPLAKNVKEGKEILSATKKNGIKLMVGYPFRFSPSFKALKDKIESGEMGEVQIAYATNIASGPFLHRAEGDIPHPVPEWWMNKELTGGGALIDLGSHMINLTRWYFGEVNEIKAYLGYRFNFDFEDHAICIANFASGTKAIINVGWFSQKTALGVELYGTVAHASAYHSAPSKIITALQLILRKTPKYFLSHRKEVSHFVNCIKEDLQPSPSGEDALKDLEIIEKAYKNQIPLD